MSNESFGRIVKIRIFATIIGESGGTPEISYENGYTEFSSVQPNGEPGFRIRGKCIQTQPTVAFHTNWLNISIYNLGPDSRAIIQSKVGTRIGVYAGYGDNAKQIAVADILRAKTYKNNSDYITDIEAGDAQFGLINCDMNKSFKGPTTYAQAINACLQNLEEVAKISTGVIVMPSGGWNQGIVLNGSTMPILADICRKANSNLTVLSGVVNILPVGQDLGSPVIEISTETGLIGIPELQPPGINGVQNNDVPVTPDQDAAFTHLLRSELILSQRVRIKSKFVNGDYVIGRVEQDFDSWSGPFYSRCQVFKINTKTTG